VEMNTGEAPDIFVVLFIEVLGGGTGEGEVSREDLVKDDAEGVDIHGLLYLVRHLRRGAIELLRAR